MHGWLDVLTDPIAWAARWGLRPFPVKCQKCGRDTVMNIPWASGEWRGLRSPRCVCGHEGAPYCMVRDYRVGDLFSPATPKRRKSGRRKLAVVIRFPTP